MPKMSDWTVLNLTICLYYIFYYLQALKTP